MALVGQALGGGRPERAARAGWTAFALGAGVMSVMGAVFFTLATPMFLLFCPGEGQRPIVEAGVAVPRLGGLALPPPGPGPGVTATPRAGRATRRRGAVHRVALVGGWPR